MGKEKNIENRIKDYLKSIGSHCFSYKVHGDMFTPKGTPDITGCLWGRHFEIEVKQPGEKPEPIQKRMMKKWRRAGAIVGVAYSLGDVKKLLEPYIIRPGDIVKIVAWNHEIKTRSDLIQFNSWFHLYGEVLESYDENSDFDFEVGRIVDGKEYWASFHYNELEKVMYDVDLSDRAYSFIN